MIQLTEEQKKLLANKGWRMDHMYKIVDKKSNLIQYKRNRAQREFDEQRHSRNIILKSRRLGFTTHKCVDMFDDSMFNQNYSGMMIAHEKGVASDIFESKIKVLWNNFPLNPLYHRLRDQSGVLKVGFNNELGDSTVSSLEVGLSGRGKTINHLHVTELAKMQVMYPERAKEAIKGTVSAVPMDGKVDIESTAERDFGIFYSLYVQAVENFETNKGKLQPVDYKPFFFNWTYEDDEIDAIKEIIPIDKMDNKEFFQERKDMFNLTDKQITFYYLKYLSLDRDEYMLKQEYPTTWQEAFISSGNKFFSQKTLDMQRTREPVVAGKWKFYARYDPTHVYVIGADPSGGKGEDNAAAVVIDLTVGEMVAEFVDKWTPPEMFAFELVEKAKLYNNAVLAIEENNHGHAVIVAAKNLGYSNFYYRLSQNKADDKEGEEIGFNTNSRTKPMIMNGLSTALNDLALRIPSKYALQEIRSYPREQLDKIIRDPEDGHFDRVMALAIAWEARKYAPKRGAITTQSYS
jgi:hypothetical protein